MLLGDVKPQLAAIQAFSSSKPQKIQPVSVVADEQAWCSADFGTPLREYVKAPHRKQPHDFERGPNHRRPFRESVPTPPFAFQDHEWVHTDGGIVEEDTSIHRGSIYRPGVRFGDDVDRVLKMERDSKIPGQMVERAKGNDPERSAGVDESRSNGADRAVAAGDDHGIYVLSQGLIRGGTRRGREFASRQHIYLGKNAMLRERGKHGLADGVITALLDCSGVFV